MLLRQLARGPLRGREPVRPRRARGRATRRALEVIERGVRAAPALRVARARRSSPHSGLAHRATSSPTWTPSARFDVPGVRVADPKACQCGEVLKGVIKPWECKVFGTACTPGDADRHLHGLLRGRVRGVLQLRPLRARAGGRADDGRHRARARSCGIDRDRAGEAPEVPRRAHHDVARRRRQGDRHPDRGALPAAFA